MLKRYCFSLCCSLFLLSCSSSDSTVWHAPAQQWQAFHIHYETRPEQLRRGMNEFLIFVERKGQKHIPDLLVKIQINHDAIQQAMPDGALGIYRRALLVHNPQQDQLHVHLFYHGQQGELTFRLAPDAHTQTPATH